MSLHILHLEDDSYDGELIIQALMAEGLNPEVTRVETRPQFEEALQTRKFDVILADYALPAYNGVAALEFAQGNAPETPFLFVTGTLGEEVAVETLKSGATDYVIKTHLERLGPSVRRALRDVQEAAMRRRAEAEVRESQELLAQATEAANAGTWCLHLDNSEFTCSAKTLAFHGLPPSATFDLETAMERIHPADRQRIAEAIAKVRQDHSDFRAEYRVCWPDQTIRWVNSLGKVVPGPAGPRLLGLIQDITERRMAEEELRASKEALSEANAAKDRFMAVLSHELRTPLSPVMLLTSELKEDPSLPAEVREEIAEMQRNLELEARLIDDLLDLTRIANKKLLLELAPLDLHDAVRGAAEILRADLEKKSLEFYLELRARNAVVRGDGARLQQIFWNLIVNAIKFTPKNGRITVRTEDKGSDQIAVTVLDTGTGIDPDELQAIFDPFHQTNERSGGLGLGLAICKSLIELHGGTITASSRGKGLGARFCVTIPRYHAEVPVTKVQASHDVRSMTGSRILIVEDHMATANALTRAMRRRGYKVEHAATGAEAIALCEQNQFDLMISDLGLPDRPGVEVIREARERWGLVSIAVSGFGMESDVAATRSAGCRIHLIKPISIEKLEAAIRECVQVPPLCMP